MSRHLAVCTRNRNHRVTPLSRRQSCLPNLLIGSSVTFGNVHLNFRPRKTEEKKRKKEKKKEEKAREEEEEIIIILNNFCIALVSGLPKLTELYNILQYFLSFTNIIHIIMTRRRRRPVDFFVSSANDSHFCQ